MTKRYPKLLIGLFALFAISLVLRPPVAIIGPLLPELIEKIGLNQIQVGVLSAAPVFCFGIGAFMSPWFVKKFGLHKSMLIVLMVLMISIGFRALGGYATLLVGTLAAGLSIAVANVLLPSIVRVDYPKQVTILTGGYTTVLALSASFAASSAVPLSIGFGGWQFVLAIWLLPAVLAVLLWLPQLKNREPEAPQILSVATDERAAVMRSPITWAIVTFFGIQSLGFYCVLNWLPSVLIDAGESPINAGALLGLTTFVGVPTGLLLSSFFSKFKSLGPLGLALSLVSALGFSLLFIGQDLTLAGCVLIGLGTSATFPLSLTLISIRASTKAQTTTLSAVAQGYGYLIAALGTFAFGLLRDLTPNWQLSIGSLVVLTLVQAVSVLVAGRPKLIPAS